MGNYQCEMIPGDNTFVVMMTLSFRATVLLFVNIRVVYQLKSTKSKNQPGLQHDTHDQVQDRLKTKCDMLRKLNYKARSFY